jgi:hypothetical protein
MRHSHSCNNTNTTEYADTVTGTWRALLLPLLSSGLPESPFAGALGAMARERR